MSVYACMNMHMYIYMYTYAWGSAEYGCLGIKEPEKFVDARYIHTCTYMYVYIYVCGKWGHLDTPVKVHTCIHTCIHTYIHT